MSMKLFSSPLSRHLASSISDSINILLANYELVTFGDSELKPVVKEDVRGEDCIIITSTSNPVNDSYMELFLLVDALKRGAAERITVVMPYFGYARQNQQHLPGEPVSARVMVKFIQTVGVDELITIDLHEEQLTGFFDIPLAHLSALPLLANALSKEIPQDSNVIVMSPDQGGVERTRKFRDALALTSQDKLKVSTEIGIVEKLRNLENQHETKFIEITGDVADKTVIIPDDVIVSGGTIVHAAQAVKDKGAAAVYLAATHADFIHGTTETLQNAPIEKVLVTDTIEISEENHFEKLSIVSVTDLLSTHLQGLKK